jgi:hypothetical protein
MGIYLLQGNLLPPVAILLLTGLPYCYCGPSGNKTHQQDFKLIPERTLHAITEILKNFAH